MSEGTLASMASVSKKMDLSEAKSLIAQMTLERLRQIKSGRGSERSIIAKDWRMLNSADATELARLRGLPMADAQEPHDHKLVDRILEVQSTDQRSENEQGDSLQNDDADSHEDSEDLSGDDQGQVSIETSDMEKPTNSSDKKPKLSCCPAVPRSTINRLNRTDPFGHGWSVCCLEDTEGVSCR